MNFQARLYNITLYILGLGSIHRYGDRKLIPNEPVKKVLLIQLAALGDMVCFTPVFRALKKANPNVKVYVVGNSINKDLLEHNNDVDEYIVFDPKKITEIAKQLKTEDIDAACIRGFGLSSLVLALLAGIPTIVSPIVTSGETIATRTYSRLAKHVLNTEYEFGKYMPRQFLKLLEPLGITEDDTTKHLGYSEKARATIVKYLKDNSLNDNDFIVGITPSAGNKIKEWPLDRFAEVADHVIENHNAKVVLIGGPRDSAMLKGVYDKTKNKSLVINSGGIFSIDEMKALIDSLSFFISVDTGPIYVAEAFNVPTVNIVGPVDEREQPPIGPLHRSVVPDRTKAELSILNSRMYDEKEALRQVHSISVFDVSTIVDELIRDISKQYD